MYSEHKKYKAKSKSRTIEALQIQYQLVREEKKRINPDLGYFLSDSEFVPGTSISQLKKKIEEKKLKIDLAKEEEKKSKKIEDKVRIKGASHYLNHELNDL